MAAATERADPVESIHPAVNVSGAETTRLFQWVQAVTGRALVAESRLPTVRPAWRIDLQGPRDATTPFVIRCARPAGFGLSTVYSLQREARVLRSLARHGFPVPRVEAESADPEALLLECMPGTSDFALLDARPAWKQTVVDHFIELLVRLHAIPVADLDVPGAAPRGRHHTGGARRARHLEGAVSGCRRTSGLPAVLRAGMARAERTAEPRVRAGQGDTGPNQCLFDERGVTGVLDWELAHVGDPMEDLGWIAARTFFASFGSLPQLLRRYAALSARDLDFKRIGYYRVMALVKCAIATAGKGVSRSRRRYGSILCRDTITRHALAWSLAENTTGARPTEPQPVTVPTLDAVPAAIAGGIARARCGSVGSLRRAAHSWPRGCGRLVRTPASACGRPPPQGLVDGTSAPGAADAAVAQQFLACEQLDSTLLAEAFGERGRIRLEALQ